jgi:hypothetical protein
MVFKLLLVFLAIHQAASQSDRFIVKVTEFVKPNFFGDKIFRCYSSVITDKHVLTTARCATTPSGKGLAITTEITTIWENGASSGSSKSHKNAK